MSFFNKLALFCEGFCEGWKNAGANGHQPIGDEYEDVFESDTGLDFDSTTDDNNIGYGFFTPPGKVSPTCGYDKFWEYR